MITWWSRLTSLPGEFRLRLADRAPRIAVSGDGTEAWVFDGHRHPQIGLNAVVGRPRDEWSIDPANFSDMRRGCWDPEARIADMDVDGVWASVHYPSLIAGFAGTTFTRCSDPELGLACVPRLERLARGGVGGPSKERFVPLQIPWLADPEVAAAEIRGRGARFQGGPLPRVPGRAPAVHPQRPLGPVLRACEETGHRRLPARRVAGLVRLTSPGTPLERSPPCSRRVRW